MCHNKPASHLTRLGKLSRLLHEQRTDPHLKQRHVHSPNTCVSHCQNSACCSDSKLPPHRSPAGCRNFKTAAWEKFHPSKIKSNPNTTFVTEYASFYRYYGTLNTHLWENTTNTWTLWEKSKTILHRSADFWKACKPPDSTMTNLGLRATAKHKTGLFISFLKQL